MSSAAIDPALQRDIATLARPGLLIGHRVITPGDEHALLEEEAASIASPLIAKRRASGAARIVARELLAHFGHGARAVPRDAYGAPVWPEGILGSMAHDGRVAVAALARAQDVTAVGIDVEPAEPLPTEMLELIATPRELLRIADDPLRGRLLFAAKEVTYKAAYRLDGAFLEFHDIEVDIENRKAVTTTGRTLVLSWCLSTHLVVLAVA